MSDNTPVEESGSDATEVVAPYVPAVADDGSVADRVDENGDRIDEEEDDSDDESEESDGDDD